jgi:hypothetical protein
MNTQPDREALAALFEETLGERLPDEYRGFLLSGPMPRWPADADRDDFYRDLANSFADLVPADPEWDLTAWYERSRNQLPDALMPIARDQFGNLVCLGVHGAHRGMVCYWKHDAADSTEEWDSVMPMWDSFAEFLTKLGGLATKPAV